MFLITHTQKTSHCINFLSFHKPDSLFLWYLCDILYCTVANLRLLNDSHKFIAEILRSHASENRGSFYPLTVEDQVHETQPLTCSELWGYRTVIWGSNLCLLLNDGCSKRRLKSTARLFLWSRVKMKIHSMTPHLWKRGCWCMKPQCLPQMWKK